MSDETPKKVTLNDLRSAGKILREVEASQRTTKNTLNAYDVNVIQLLQPMESVMIFPENNEDQLLSFEFCLGSEEDSAFLRLNCDDENEHVDIGVGQARELYKILGAILGKK